MPAVTWATGCKANPSICHKLWYSVGMTSEREAQDMTGAKSEKQLRAEQEAARRAAFTPVWDGDKPHKAIDGGGPKCEKCGRYLDDALHYI